MNDNTVTAWMLILAALIGWMFGFVTSLPTKVIGEVKAISKDVIHIKKDGQEDYSAYFLNKSQLEFVEIGKHYTFIKTGGELFVKEAK